MNTNVELRTKAQELIAQGAGYGLEPKIDWESRLAIHITYAPRLFSVVTHTETGKVRVESFERMGRRTEKISLKNLPDYLEYAASKIKA